MAFPGGEGREVRGGEGMPSESAPKRFGRFEDFAAGQELPLAPHRMTREAIVAFASQFDPQPFHTDEAAAAGSFFGGLAASGWHSFAVLLRMMCDGWLSADAAVRFDGVEQMRWRRPVRPGDVLGGRSLVLAAEPADAPDEGGAVRFRHEVTNAAGDLVMEVEHRLHFRPHPAAS